MYTLIVVDMQDEFETAKNPKTISACQREIKLAIRKNYGIIFLEIGPCGDTISELKDLVKGYDKAYFATKMANDGSVEAFNIIKRRNLYHNTRIVGVNTSYCVYDTVKSLMNYPGKITVVSDACNCNSQQYGLNKLKRLKIKIIEEQIKN